MVERQAAPPPLTFGAALWRRDQKPTEDLRCTPAPPTALISSCRSLRETSRSAVAPQSDAPLVVVLPGPMNAIHALVREALLHDEAAAGGYHDVGPEVAADRELVRYGDRGEFPFGGDLRTHPEHQDVADLGRDIDRPCSRYHGNRTRQQRGEQAGEQRRPDNIRCRARRRCVCDPSPSLAWPTARHGKSRANCDRSGKVIMIEPLRSLADGSASWMIVPGRCDNDIAILFAHAATHFCELDLPRMMSDHDHASILRTATFCKE